MHDALSEPPAPTPSGAEVMAQDRADAYNAVLQRPQPRGRLPLPAPGAEE